MHIILLILKILGILLLVILGLLLLVLCTVLFVPVRYRIRGLWKEEKWVSVQVSWLLSLIAFQGSYDREKGLAGSLRILWFKLWKMGDEETESPLEPEQKEEKNQEPEKEQEPERKEDKLEDPKKGVLVQTMEIRPEEDEKKTPTKAADRDKNKKENEKKTHVSPENRRQKEEPQKTEEKENTEEKSHETIPRIPLSERIKTLWTRIRAFFQKLKFSFWRFCDKLKDIRALIQEKKEWLEDEKNQESLRLLFKQFKKLLAHVWPCKGKGTVTFGLEDPYYTGQILAGASFLYPFFYKRLSLQPVFDEICLEAELDYRGRIRVSYLLWLFWGIFHHKHTWKMVRGFLDRDNSLDE